MKKQDQNNKYTETGYESTVEAIYSESECIEDKGNIFIEALPQLSEDAKTLIDSYTSGLPFYNYNTERLKSDYEKRKAILAIRSIRTFLPFMSDLENSFNNLLITSYRDRKLQFGDYRDNQHSRLISNTGSSTSGGIALLGYSGCGKSTAIQMLTNKYPQVIIHHIDGYELKQIVYLTVCCPANSNLSVLYEQFGRAVDKALNVDIYGELIRRTAGLGKKQARVETLIERFNIGMIILDEIQLLDFKSNKESSFESLMVIMNNTKVGMTVVGTEDAFHKMFTKLRTARRLEHPIKGSLYCDNKAFFETILCEFWEYQWFDERVELTNDIVEAFYEATRGIIALTASLFISVQDEYLQASKKNRPKITAEFINKVSDKCYPNIKTVLNNLEQPNGYSALDAVLEEIRLKQEQMAYDGEQQETMDSIIVQKKAAKRETIIQSAIDSITNFTDSYTISEVSEAVRNNARSMELEDAKELTRKSIKTLKDKKPKKKQKMSNIDMYNELYNCN